MNDQDLLRYSRHLMLEHMDIEGQQRLVDSHVMIVGLGGLGCPVALYLAAAGVGQLTLVDPDQVELTNLQRQVAHGEADIGRFKTDSARDAIARINSLVKVNSIPRAADESWLKQTLSNIDLVLDCTDNSNVRYQLNVACLQQQVPWLSAAATGWSGHLIRFDPARQESPCYGCLYPQPVAAESCAEVGVLAPMVGMVGCMQAIEAIRLLTGAGQQECGQLRQWDGLTGEQYTLKVARRADCRFCQSAQ